jgi:O-antigen ligase
MIAFFYVMILISIAIYNITFIQEKIDATIEIFKTSESKTIGSSLIMRNKQLDASYHQFLKNPIFGNGFYYVNENLGWAKNPEDRIRDDDFQGFESYIYQLLIEQGSIGILINIIFFSSIFLYFLRRRLLIKEISALGLTILAMFLTFIIGTGTVNSWIISMGLIGILIKYIEQTLANENE